MRNNSQAGPPRADETRRGGRSIIGLILRSVAHSTRLEGWNGSWARLHPSRRPREERGALRMRPVGIPPRMDAGECAQAGLGSQRPLDRLDPVAFDHVAGLHVVIVLERHAAFLAGHHLAGIVLETLELGQL